MQASLFDAAPLPRGKPPAKPQAQASAPAPRKGHQEPADTTNAPKARGEHQAKPRTVARGKNYKPRRHPTRAPAKKKIVKTRPVRLLALPEGPTGQIVDSITANGQRYVSVQWEHRPAPSLHNPMYLIPVLD